LLPERIHLYSIVLHEKPKTKTHQSRSSRDYTKLVSFCLVGHQDCTGEIPEGTGARPRGGFLFVFFIVAAVTGMMTCSRPVSITALGISDVTLEPSALLGLIVRRTYVKTARGLGDERPGRYFCNFRPPRSCLLFLRFRHSANCGSATRRTLLSSFNYPKTASRCRLKQTARSLVFGSHSPCSTSTAMHLPASCGRRVVYALGLARLARKLMFRDLPPNSSVAGLPSPSQLINITSTRPCRLPLQDVSFSRICSLTTRLQHGNHSSLN